MPTHSAITGVLLALLGLTASAVAQETSPISTPVLVATSTPTPPSGNTVPPVTRGDYTQLETYLKAQQWEEADVETYSVMLKVANRESDGYFDSASLKVFPCKDLQAINQLWSQYSDGRFGFSAQKQIWIETGNPTDGTYDWETYDKFADQVGWRINGSYLYYDDITFDISAPVGHLPFPLVPYTHALEAIFLAPRLANCSL